jgi:hypothetical protein
MKPEGIHSQILLHTNFYDQLKEIFLEPGLMAHATWELVLGKISVQDQ